MTSNPLLLHSEFDQNTCFRNSKWLQLSFYFQADVFHERSHGKNKHINLKIQSKTSENTLKPVLVCDNLHEDCPACIEQFDVVTGHFVFCFRFVDKGSIKVPLPNYVMGSFKTLNWFGAVH